MKFDIKNRRDIGSKVKLLGWIFENINLKGIRSAFDIFAGTGAVSEYIIKNTKVDSIKINDFLYSNEVIYKAFFLQSSYDLQKIQKIKVNLNNISLQENYFSQNFGGNFFSHNDAIKIGQIREVIENLDLNEKEKSILLASLIYSCDRAANTVGHFEAYRKNENTVDKFKFELIKPIKTNKKIEIYRKDANDITKNQKADFIFIDPPYNSRQYSRFYHIYENLVKWEKPELFGVALKPKPENLSEYCRSSAVKVFKNLIENLDCKTIAVTYNNTYNSKSSSSKNKISFEQIYEILSKKGSMKILEQKYKFFNTGKTDLNNHKEYLFLVSVK